MLPALPEPPSCPLRPQYAWLVAGAALANAALYAATALLLPRLPWPGRRAYAALPAGARADWNSRVVSNANALVALAAFWHVAFVDPAGRAAAADPLMAVFLPSCDRDLAMLALAGYLAYDLCLCLSCAALRDPLTLAHHGVVLLAYLNGVHSGFATAYMSSLLVNEASTPFVNARSFMLHQGRQGGALYMANGALIAVTFLLFRILATVAVVAHITYAWVSLWDVAMAMPASQALQLAGMTLLAVLHLMLNGVWFWKIVRNLSRRLGGGGGGRGGARPKQA